MLTAACVATSSTFRLNASPVGENPSGDISTSASACSVRSIISVSILRTTPVCWKSTPSTMPTGRATTKLPLTTRILLLAIGVLGRPCENAASISSRIPPAASFTQASAAASVIRSPPENEVCSPLSCNCACTCGLDPCTSTNRMPSACSSDRSCTSAFKCPVSISSPSNATTKVRPRFECTYGATARSHATNCAWLNAAVTGEGGAT